MTTAAAGGTTTSGVPAAFRPTPAPSGPPPGCRDSFREERSRAVRREPDRNPDHPTPVTDAGASVPQLDRRIMPMSEERYHLSARLLHWFMALGFAFMWTCGFAMTTLVEDDSPLEELLFDLHISIGVTLLALLVLRIAIRLAYPPPPLPDTIRGMERTAAHLGHAALYALPALVIAAGWAETNFAGHAVQWFGVEMMRVFPETGEELQDLSEALHMWLAYAMLAVAVGHVAAAFRHRSFNGHDVIRRMTFSSK